SGVYNGNPFSASAAAKGVNNAIVSGNFTFTYYVGSSASGTGTATAPSTPGTYTVVANFSSSDANYIGAQSSPVTFTISQATTATTLTSSAILSVTAQQVALTATVAVVTGAGAPTGTLTFFDGSTVLGTAAVVNGHAMLTTSSLALGNH